MNEYDYIRNMTTYPTFYPGYTRFYDSLIQPGTGQLLSKPVRSTGNGASMKILTFLRENSFGNNIGMRNK